VIYADLESELPEKKHPTFLDAVKKGAKKFMEDTEKVWKQN
jgi:hypothetical protein